MMNDLKKMLKNMTLILILGWGGLVTSCNTSMSDPVDVIFGNSSQRRYSATDPAFSSYIRRFENDAGQYYNSQFYVGDIPVNFGQVKDFKRKLSRRTLYSIS